MMSNLTLSNITYGKVKRALDITGATVMLTAALPAFAVIAVLIKAESPGPVFFVHRRVGHKGRPIRIYKFRSMRPGAEDLEAELNDEDLESYYQEFKLKDDPRVTEIGHRLRQLSLDELPQLVNVLQGRMSLVGPRPVMEEELGFYTDEEVQKLLSVRPGLTGYWQVNGRDEATYQSGRRQETELWYVDNATLMMDIKILLKTPFYVINTNRGNAGMQSDRPCITRR